MALAAVANVLAVIAMALAVVAPALAAIAMAVAVIAIVLAAVAMVLAAVAVVLAVVAMEAASRTESGGRSRKKKRPPRVRGGRDASKRCLKDAGYAMAGTASGSGTGSGWGASLASTDGSKSNMRAMSGDAAVMPQPIICPSFSGRKSRWHAAGSLQGWMGGRFDSPRFWKMAADASSAVISPASQRSNVSSPCR